MKNALSDLQAKLNSIISENEFESNKLAYHLGILEKKKIVRRIIVKENSNAVIQYKMTGFCLNLIQNMKSFIDVDVNKTRENQNSLN